MSAVTVEAARTRGMVRIPGGQFRMGDDRYYPEEAPVTNQDVGALWIDRHPVTNADFRRFVKDTGYVTVAEIAPTREAFPDAHDEDLVPGSLVFVGTPGPVPLDDWTQWWEWTPGADWRHPAGPGSTLHGRDLHPVVHIGLEDALAYAAWAGKRLPTEVEWEFAARGGLDGAVFAWGDEFMPRGKVMANTWHGRVPVGEPAPAWLCRDVTGRPIPPNAYGLHDVTGNVWEWTTTPWSVDHSDAGPACCAPEANHGPRAEDERYVTKGGSHLCAPTYCLRYRPAARQGHSVRSATNHLGFHCVVSADARSEESAPSPPNPASFGAAATTHGSPNEFTTTENDQAAAPPTPLCTGTHASPHNDG